VHHENEIKDFSEKDMTKKFNKKHIRK